MGAVPSGSTTFRVGSHVLLPSQTTRRGNWLLRLGIHLKSYKVEPPPADFISSFGVFLPKFIALHGVNYVTGGVRSLTHLKH